MCFSSISFIFLHISRISTYTMNVIVAGLVVRANFCNSLRIMSIVSRPSLLWIIVLQAALVWILLNNTKSLHYEQVCLVLLFYWLFELFFGGLEIYLLSIWSYSFSFSELLFCYVLFFFCLFYSFHILRLFQKRYYLLYFV